MRTDPQSLLSYNGTFDPVNPAVHWQILVVFREPVQPAVVQQAHRLVDRILGELANRETQTFGIMSRSVNAPTAMGSHGTELEFPDNGQPGNCQVFLTLTGPASSEHFTSIAQAVLTQAKESEPPLVLSAPGVREHIYPSRVQFPALTRRNRG